MGYLYEDERYGAARRAVGTSRETMAMLDQYRASASGGAADEIGYRAGGGRRDFIGAYESPMSKSFHRQHNHASYKSYGSDSTMNMIGSSSAATKTTRRYGIHTRFGYGNINVIEPLHDWPAMLGAGLLIIMLMLCISLVVHHGEIFAGTIGIIIALVVAVLWVAAVVKARRDVKQAEKTIRELSDDQRRLLGLVGTEYDGRRGSEYDYIDDDYGFGIARDNYGKNVIQRETGDNDNSVLLPASSSARKRVIRRNIDYDNQRGRSSDPYRRSSADGSRNDDDGRWSEYIARWNEEEDEITLRNFESQLELENKREEEALGVNSRFIEEFSPFGRSPDMGQADRNVSPLTKSDFSYDGRDNNKSATNTPSPLPAAPLTYRPSPKDRTASRQQSNDEFWPTDEDEREALKHLRISSTLWNESPDLIREWMSERMIKPLYALCESSHLRVSEALMHIATKEEWAQKFGLSLPLPTLANTVKDKGLSETGSGADLDTTLSTIKSLLQQHYRQQQQQRQDSLPLYRQALQALNIHLHLIYLLRGEYPPHLMAPIPSGYAFQRIEDLSEGTCCSAFTWDSGSAWGSRVHFWTDAVPSDTHLVIYLFLAYVNSYSWTFPVDPLTGEDIPHGLQGSLFSGELPLKSRGRGPFSAVLPVRPRERVQDAFLMICSPLVHPPQINIIDEEKYVLMLSGHSAAFHTILLLIVRARNHHGGCLGLEMNIGSPMVGLQEILDSSDVLL